MLLFVSQPEKKLGSGAAFAAAQANQMRCLSMKIQVNGNDVTLDTAPTIQELLVLQKAEMPDYVSVQVNDDFVPRAEFGTRHVADGDTVEFLYFMGGGQCEVHE